MCEERRSRREAEMDRRAGGLYTDACGSGAMMQYDIPMERAAQPKFLRRHEGSLVALVRSSTAAAEAGRLMRPAPRCGVCLPGRARMTVPGV